MRWSRLRHSYPLLSDVPGLAKRVASGLAVLGVALLAAEAAARLDDFMFADVPIAANPDREFDLTQIEAWGARGKPYGHYRKWTLNSFGFLGPEMAAAPTRRRVMVLGASETFGLFESAGQNYPAQLQHELAQRGRSEFEIVNAALPGMALPSISAYWEGWAIRFQPELVLIYPSSHFYLSTEVPKPQALQSAPRQPTPPRLQSRFAERIKDLVKQLPALRAIRSWFVVSQALAGRGPDYLFTTNPDPGRLAAFEHDLEALADAVARSGAIPVLITHAFQTPSPPAAQDLAALEYFRIFLPRAQPAAIPAFVAAARQSVIGLGQRRGWRVIDAAGALSGHRELFADPVHFNDVGSRRIAGLISDELTTLAITSGGQR